MARAVKEATVAELTARFRGSSGAVLTEYRGLTVTQVKELRQALGEDASFSVVKNTLTKIAAKDAGITADFTQLLVGPSAIAFVGGDVVQAAKGLRDYAKANPLLVIKGGVLDGKMMTPDEIAKLADLESRDVLLAKLAGAMKATMAGAAATFAALPAQMARLLAALEEKKAAEGPAAAAGAAPEAAPADAITEDAPKDAAPQDTAPQDTAPQDTAPQDTAPEDTAPQDAAPEDAAPEDAATNQTDAGGPDGQPREG
jgi:large subunit ribosomal protein L10